MHVSLQRDLPDRIGKAKGNNLQERGESGGSVLLPRAAGVVLRRGPQPNTRRSHERYGDRERPAAANADFHAAADCNADRHAAADIDPAAADCDRAPAASHSSRAGIQRSLRTSRGRWRARSGGGEYAVSAGTSGDDSGAQDAAALAHALRGPARAPPKRRPLRRQPTKHSQPKGEPQCQT